MARFNHILRANHSTETWRNLLLFDTETYIKEDNEGNQNHTLRLGWTCYVRRDTGMEEYQLFTTPEAFWRIVSTYCRPKERIVVMSHNLFFDLSQVEMFTRRWLSDFELSNPCVGKNGFPFFFTLKARDRSLLFVDSLNLLPGSLRSIASSLGMIKGNQDFKNATQEELSKYCRQDVKILKTAVCRWLEFLVDNDLGCAQKTLAGQAHNAYRHRFMPHPLYLHTHPAALRMELDSYHGGRCEVFKVGTFFGVFHKLDINSMYPYIMRSCELPTRLCGFYESGVTEKLLRKLCKEFFVIAELDLQTSHAAYGHTHNKRLCFPIGAFSETLCQASLMYALKHSHIVNIKRVACYEKHVIFKDFVDYFYNARLDAKEKGDDFLVYAFKILMNSLYGKFAQKAHDTVVVTGEDEDWHGTMPMLAPVDLRKYLGARDQLGEQTFDLKDNVEWTVYSLFGKLVYSRDIDEQDKNAFAAIASGITDYARHYLWKLIQLAGVNNVYYVDTDSLIVNTTGMENLSAYMGKQLGQLKHEGMSKELAVYAPKDYIFAGKHTLKGIKSNAQWLEDKQAYKQQKWTRLKGFLRQPQPDVYRVMTVYKKLKREIKTKVVLRNGETLPLTLP